MKNEEKIGKYEARSTKLEVGRKNEARNVEHEVGRGNLKVRNPKPKESRPTVIYDGYKIEYSTVHYNKQLGLTAHTVYSVIEELAIMAC